jgi:hypothetical protein
MDQEIAELILNVRSACDALRYYNENGKRVSPDDYKDLVEPLKALRKRAQGTAEFWSAVSSRLWKPDIPVGQMMLFETPDAYWKRIDTFIKDLDALSQGEDHPPLDLLSIIHILMGCSVALGLIEERVLRQSEQEERRAMFRVV